MARNSNFQGIPLVSQCRTLDFMNLADLIDYSLISPSTRDLVRYYHKRCDKMEWTIGAYGHYRIEITDELNQFLNGDDFGLNLMVKVSTAPRDSIRRMFGDWEVFSVKKSGMVWAYCRKHEAIEILESFSRELLELFKIREHDLSISYTVLKDNLDIFQRLPRFETVEIVGDHHDDELSSEVMDFLMNQLDCDELQILHCGLDPEYKFNGHLNLKRFSTNKVDWITGEFMQRMSCQRIHIWKGYDDNRSIRNALNALINMWLTGGLEDLKLLTTSPFKNYAMDRIMEDIDCIDYDSAIHQGEFQGKDVSDGYYIVRASDGMVATIHNDKDADVDNESWGFKWIIWR